MIVFDLKCGADHVFEAWFGSSGAYEAQAAAGQIACPVCGDVAVAKAVMAPAVAAKGNSRPATMDAATMKRTLQAMAQAQAKALESSTWVGGGFAAKARAIHAGEAPEAVIHGQATVAEARELVEEGVPVAPLLFPVVPPEAVN